MNKLFTSIFLLCSSLLLSFPANAQNEPGITDEHQLNWGSRKKSKTATAEYIGRDANGNHVYHGYRTSFIPLPFFTIVKMKEYIRIYDDEMHWQEDLPLDVPAIKFNNWNARKVSLRTVEKFAGAQYLFYTDKSSKSNHTFCVRQIDINTRKAGKEVKLLRFNSAKDKAPASGIRYQFSKDSTKLLFYYQIIHPKGYKGKQQVRYFVVDQNLKVIKEGSQDIQTGSKKGSLLGQIITNSGEVVFLSKELKSKEPAKGKKGKKPAPKKKGEEEDEEEDEGGEEKKKSGDEFDQPYVFNVWFAKDGVKGMQATEFQTDAGKVKSMSIGIGHDDNEVLLFGTITGNTSRARYFDELEKYVFTAVMNLQGEILSENIPSDLDNGGEEEEEDEDGNPKKKKQVSRRGTQGSVYLDHFYYDSDSNYYVVGENFGRSIRVDLSNTSAVGLAVSASGAGNNGSIRYVSIYGNIVVMKFSKEGKFLWKKIVYKERYEESLYEMPRMKDYFVRHYNGKIVLAFNDPHIYLHNSPKKAKGSIRTATYMVEVDSKGELNKYRLGGGKKDKNYYTPFIRATHLHDNGNMVFIGYKGLTARKSKLGYINLNGGYNNKSED